jgi:hypothetical protein
MPDSARSCNDLIALVLQVVASCLGPATYGRYLRSDKEDLDAMTIKQHTPIRWLAPAATWPLTHPLVLATVLGAACSVGPDSGGGNTAPASPDSPGQPVESSPATTTRSEGTRIPPSVAGGTPLKITIADTVITARLADNATARDLAAQLPLTLAFKDFHQVEKIAKLPRPLSMEGVPAGDDPDIGNIGYYAPSGDLVFYYGDVGYWNGIVRIGRFDTTMELIEQQPDNFQVTIERSGPPGVGHGSDN